MEEVKSDFTSHAQPCVWVQPEAGLYPKGAHRFEFANSFGWDAANNRTGFTEGRQTLQFVHKDTEGVITEGITSEQLLVALIHRHEQLNEAFPCDENKEMVAHMQAALACMAKRVQDRVRRGVMGDLKR